MSGFPIFGVVSSCNNGVAPAPEWSSPSAMDSDGALSDRLFNEVNAYRVSVGKKALWRHQGLDQLAQKHCDYLVKTSGRYGLYGKNVSHMGFESRALTARQAYKITHLSENVVTSTDHSPAHLVRVWASSKAHHHNMKSNWECTGVATAMAPDGRVVATQLFGNAPSTSHRMLPDRLRNHW